MSIFQVGGLEEKIWNLGQLSLWMLLWEQINGTGCLKWRIKDTAESVNLSVLPCVFEIIWNTNRTHAEQWFGFTVNSITADKLAQFLFCLAFHSGF
jgi:hypothetical protein